jgi:hypothetical protein
MSTQLCWVFNQAVPAWNATALMLNEKDKSAFALIGLAILPRRRSHWLGWLFYAVYCGKGFCLVSKEKTACFVF